MQHLESHLQSSCEIRRSSTLHIGHGHLQLVPIVRRGSYHFAVEATDQRLWHLVENHNVHKVIVAQGVQDGVHSRLDQRMRPPTHRFRAVQQNELELYYCTTRMIIICRPIQSHPIPSINRAPSTTYNVLGR